MERSRRARVWCFGAYCLVMVWLLFGRERPGVTDHYWTQAAMNVNLRPLHTIGKYVRILCGNYSEALRRHAVVNLAGNVVMFLPLGYLPPSLWQTFRPLWRCLIRCGGAIMVVEILQMLTLVGSCDVDDLLLNLVGIGLGYGLHRITARRCVK